MAGAGPHPPMATDDGITCDSGPQPDPIQSSIGNLELVPSPTPGITTCPVNGLLLSSPCPKFHLLISQAFPFSLSSNECIPKLNLKIGGSTRPGREVDT